MDWLISLGIQAAQCVEKMMGISNARIAETDAC